MSAAVTTSVDLDVLREIESRVLWLAVRMIDYANHDRPNPDGLKVGGHQASSASIVSAMVALWFAHLDANDRTSVKPHASPVLHAIKYLLGELEEPYLTQLRAAGGLQSYPSRTKDPDEVDYSTGSVGLGAAAPLFGAVTRRYVDAHFGPRPRSRFVALIGDAELDEGNIWEALADTAARGIGDLLWIVDFNRQSLDRVVPGVRIQQWSMQFEAAGWHVVQCKYGQRLQAAFRRPGGEDLRAWIDAMPNEQYQSLFGMSAPDLRAHFLDGAPQTVKGFCAGVDDGELQGLVTDLGGHDLNALLEAYAECDAVVDRPSVVFAYTIKGWGLPMAGNPRNHSALLTTEQVDELRTAHGLSADMEWSRFDPDSPAGRWVDQRARHLQRAVRCKPTPVTVPPATGIRSGKPTSTQEIFGRILVNLSRDESVAPLLVTTAPDVATSTSLAGFINRAGVFAPVERRVWSADSGLKWTEGPSGQHIELGISEMNLFLLLGQLGLSWDISDQPLLPVGTVYDPFVLRGLDAFLYSVYSGARFLVAGTPSGITLAPEGGAHQSTITASVGLELPNVTFVEPGYAVALDWLVCDALGRIARDVGPAVADAHEGAYYFRLTTRRLDQAPFEDARRRLGDTTLRAHVLAGAYRMHDASAVLRTGAPVVNLATSGALLPETLTAAHHLAEEGVAAHVVDITSLDRVYRSWRQALQIAVRTARRPQVPDIFTEVFAPGAPVVTVHDAASHAMAWLGSALGVRTVPLGVDSFGQSGSVQDLYETHELLPGHIANAALVALENPAGGQADVAAASW